MTTSIPPEDWLRIRELLRARHRAAPQPAPAPAHHCEQCQDVLLEELERGLEQVVTNATRRPAPTPLVCEP